MATKEQSENQQPATSKTGSGNRSTSLSLEDRMAGLSTKEKAAISSLADELINKLHPEQALVVLSRKYVREDKLSAIEAVDKAVEHMMEQYEKRMDRTAKVLQRAKNYVIVAYVHPGGKPDLDPELQRDIHHLIHEVPDLLKERIGSFWPIETRYKQAIAMIEAENETTRGLESLRLAETSLVWYRAKESVTKAAEGLGDAKQESQK